MIFYKSVSRSISEELGIDYAKYCRVLTRALVGKESTLSLSDTVRFHEENETLSRRLELASNMLDVESKREIDPNRMRRK